MALRPKRYQLTKNAARIVGSGHPWLFRDHLSSAASVFKSGDWLCLVGPNNEVLGYGVFDSEGLIGIRIYRRGAAPPTSQWFQSMVDKALKKRTQLRNYTTGFRALHGENDGLPGVVIDVYDNVGVLQTYSPAVDAVGRYLAKIVTERLKLSRLVWKLPAKRKIVDALSPVRMLKGKPPSVISVREGKMEVKVEPMAGQKSGAFLDLRGLRKWVASQKLQNLRVLNLFSYTGTLGLAAEVAGAKEIWNVDISQPALDTARKHHVISPTKHRWICADVFEWLANLPAKELFDVVIVDPPQMASLTSQVPNALRSYRRLFAAAAPHVTPEGILIGCCCTSRITRKQFQQTVDGVLREHFQLKKSLEPEDDHPVGFPEGDYLKMLIYALKMKKRR